MSADYCCAMRRKFLIGIVAEDPAAPNPPDLVDFIEWDVKRQDGKPLINIVYCPWCGNHAGRLRRTV